MAVSLGSFSPVIFMPGHFKSTPASWVVETLNIVRDISPGLGQGWILKTIA